MFSCQERPDRLWGRKKFTVGTEVRTVDTWIWPLIATKCQDGEWMVLLSPLHKGVHGMHRDNCALFLIVPLWKFLPTIYRIVSHHIEFHLCVIEVRIWSKECKKFVSCCAKYIGCPLCLRWLISTALLKQYIYIYIYIQGVPGGKDLTSGECSLGQTISI